MPFELRPILSSRIIPNVHFMARALEKAGLPPPRVARHGEQVEYLAGRGAFVDPLCHPPPCLVVSTSFLGASGEDAS